eukprot:jgi/Tetstr1/426925/TSEL_017138.t1
MGALGRSITIAGENGAASGSASRALAGGAAMMLAPLSLAGTVTFVATVVFVMFACPLWLVRIQKYKQKINGNWDEAVPKWSTRVTDFQRQHSLREEPSPPPACPPHDKRS